MRAHDKIEQLRSSLLAWRIYGVFITLIVIILTLLFDRANANKDRELKPEPPGNTMIIPLGKE